MTDEQIDLEEQIERCWRLRNLLTDEEMRAALEELAEAYESRLSRRKRGCDEGFMLRGKP